MNEAWIRRSVDWLKSKQNSDGGWGESPLADKDPAWRGRGSSTASQTAWAMIGLVAGEDAISESVMRGAQWLPERQNDAGGWDEIRNPPATAFRTISIFTTSCMHIIFR